MSDHDDVPVDDEIPEDEPPSDDWFTDDDGDDMDASFKDYDISASPNDFNVKTIVDFIDSGPVKIPAFQRNYVWDIKRASKLIESILIGLPIPQIFLYEEERNSFLVIDGQQRLMSLYYFAKGRFPRRAQRPAIRRIMAEQGSLPMSILSDDRYFQKFNLMLPPAAPGQSSKYHRKNFDTLGSDQITFNLRTIRNVIIKQNAPDEDGDSSVFEIFHRLNTGGVNLRQQEIRTSIYHSNFMSRLDRVNLNPEWRRLLGQPEPDLHAKDLEILLRSIAMVADGETYTEPMGRFLNLFAKKCKRLDEGKLNYIEQLFEAFFEVMKGVPEESFRVKQTNRFSIAMFEAVFRAVCVDAFRDQTLDVLPLTAERLAHLKSDQEFVSATRYGIGRSMYVKLRYDRARALLTP
ncbi:hypothetical protein E9232_006322 [Inquilinus ginsengisoli]|uniref:GmrSD restriction endonucleases N-terminal domain-containing protein n=1 Tax=Inquilinus ginsengisoli TaxID=363840 RepID=A0ABU1JYS5_9PROT|nr:DUF262 domain-containing protein [Inquilinus ginsengisoli]MDR6293769.1 hypothetical protein [Inquilinus ginsengisoli]